MSKRTQLRQRGWIEFTGLKFAQPFMTRSELVEMIHCFFEERGLSIISRQSILHIRFSQTLRPEHPEHGNNVLGWMEPFCDIWVREVVVFTRKHHDREQFVNTLFHELDHVAWIFEGKALDNSVEYWSRPHEVRARRVGDEWESRLTR